MPLRFHGSYKYAIADGLAVEVFATLGPGIYCLCSEVNYYPEFFSDYGYANLGISHCIGLGRREGRIETSYWSLNAWVGANTRIDYDVDAEEDSIPAFYMELGLGRILGINRRLREEKSMLDGVLEVWDPLGFPNIEAGARAGLRSGAK